jgi:putative acetyltransferase
MRSAVRTAPGPYRADERAAWGSLPALYHRWAMTAGGEVYVVAERSGRIAGYAALRVGLGAPSPPRASEITAVFVAPPARGRGLGAALVARLVARARRAGAAAVLVDAVAGAVQVYARLGFRGGRAIRVPLPGDRTLPARRMRLAL